MEIRALEIFLTTADLLHFGRASRACNLSPSALTRSIQRLEDEVGQSLFFRNNRKVLLTEAGDKVLRYARKTVTEWYRFQEELAADGVVRGPLSIYASVTAVYSLLPALLEKYRNKYSAVQLELRTGVAEQAVDQVLRGEIDLAVATLPDRELERLAFIPLTQTPLVFIVRRGLGYPKTGGGLLDLAQVPFVLPQSGLSRIRLNKWFKKEGIVPQINSEVFGNEALIAMVRLGSGVGIVPDLVLERSPFCDEIERIDCAPVLDPYIVGLCANNKNLLRSPVKAFWQLARDHCRDGSTFIEANANEFS